MPNHARREHGLTAVRISTRLPPPALFLLSGLTGYLGAALAVPLFATLPALTVGWLRVAVSAVILLLWWRPWRETWTRRQLGGAAVFGVALAAMNICFYVAIDHLPLGTAVAIEFLGPVAVAAVTGSGWRDRAGISLAAAGVVLLAGVTLDQGGTRSATVGLAAILTGAACWAAYILLGRKVVAGREGLSALSLAMAAGALVFAPIGSPGAGPIFASWRLCLAVIGVAVLSSVIPYVLELIVLKRVTAARFAILLAMLPVAATAVGAVVLRQVPGVVELSGTALVCAAILAQLTGGHAGTTDRLVGGHGRPREALSRHPRSLVSNVLHATGSPD